MTLYTIDTLIVHCLSCVDDETGEIPEAALIELENLEMDRVKKVSAIVAVIRNQQAVADMLEITIPRLKRMMAAPSNTVERLKSYIYSSMKLHGEKKIDCGPVGKPRIQANSQPSVKFTGDVDTLEKKWQRITVELNKSAVVDAFKKGEEIPEHVTVETGDHLRLG